MHDAPGFRMLTECDNGYISECNCCRQLNFAYKNIVLEFPQEDLIRFLEWLIEFRHQPESYQPLPHHRDRVYRSPLDNLYLAFNSHELQEIEVMPGHTNIILEARRLLGNN
jgi:hypothetical protein